MGRKNYLPGSNKSDKAIYPYDTHSFESGLIKGAPRIPDNAIADGYDIVVHPDHICGREGSTLFTSVVIPPIDGRTGYTATKTGNVITSAASFVDSDVSSFFVFPGSPDSHYEILEVLTGNTVRVSNTTDRASTAGCYLRGATNLSAWHKIQLKWIFVWGTQVYTAAWNIPSLTRCTVISVGEELSDSVCGYDDFDENTGLIFNSNGMFKVDLSYDAPIVYKINIPTPDKTILDQNKSETSEYNYHYVYSAMRLSIADNEFDSGRLSDGKIIELETGSNKWDADTYQDYADVYTDTPVGPYHDQNGAYRPTDSYVYGQLTCATLVAPYDNVGGWQGLAQNGSFKIYINELGLHEVVVDFSSVTNMTEVAAVIQSALRDFFPGVTCEFDLDHFVIKSATVKGSYETKNLITAMFPGVSANTTDVATHLRGTVAAGADVNLGDPFYAEDTVVIGPLYVPEITDTPGEYQQHLTHFPIYRSRDLMGRYKIGDEADKLNNPNDLVWEKDLRISGAFYGYFDYSGGAFPSYFFHANQSGVFEEADIGSTLEADDGSRYEITGLAYDVIVFVDPLSSPSPVIPLLAATAIGNGRVFRASQTGYTVTRTHGSTFSASDVGKTIKWSDESFDIVTGYVSPNEITVQTSTTKSTHGMTMDPSYRYYNSGVRDETLETRLTRLKLKQRFWQPLPNGNLGKVTPGLIFVASQGDNSLNYGQIPDTLEYLHGFHDTGYQITKKIVDDIQGMWLFPGILIIWTSTKTWRWATDGYQFIVNPFTKDAILQITGIDASDDDIGLFDRGSIFPVGDGSIMLLTYESGQICLRRYNGYQYGVNELETMGIQRIPDIQNLTKSTKALYDGNTGMMLFGKE